MSLVQIPALGTTLLSNYGVHRMSEQFIHHHRGPMGWDKVSFGLHPTHLVPTLDTFLDELNLIPDFTYSLTGSSVVLDTPDKDSDEWSFDATTSAFRAADILNASKPLQWYGSMEPPANYSEPIWNGIYRHPLSSAAKRLRSGHDSMRSAEKEHSVLYDLVQTFAINSLVLNLTVGTRKFPVDWKHIGPGFKMPIVFHKLQRLLNRHLIDALSGLESPR